ncbi:glutamate receptor 2.2-like [Henckelia pumila]|uniref:glutamate receptor 2.2-like n=1 Tax=Henckelia pumila TaxID=405737 RepID=UPI003C6E4CC3
MILSILYISLVLSLSGSLCDAQTGVGFNRTFQVGVILDFDSLVGRIGLTSLALAMSDFYATNPNYTTRLVLHPTDSKGQVIDAAANAISLLKDVEVDAIIGPQKSAQASFVIGLGDRANVSIISFSATSPSLHPRSKYFVQTGLNDAAQVGAIAAIVGYFHWNQVVLIYEDSDYGNGIVSFLANSFQNVNARVSYRSVIPLTTTDDFLLQELYKMKTMQTRVFVVHVSTSLASRLFIKATEAGMMGKGYAWIVTSGLMDLFYSLDSGVVNSMQGIIGVKPLIPKSRKLDSLAKRWKRKFLAENPHDLKAELSLYGLWAYDTFWALAMAAERVGFKEPASFHINITSAINSTNFFATEISKTGPKILEEILGVTFRGVGGEFGLLEGQLEPSAFQILNVVGEGVKEVGIWTNSHVLLRERNLSKASSSNKTLGTIIFPGDTTVIPRGWEVPVSGKKLRVGLPVQTGFKEFVEVERDPETNSLKVSGCYIDIFEAVMKALPYAVLFEYVPFENPDGSSAGSYDELIRQISLGKFDAVVGDITITSKRSQFGDFTMPYDVGGVTITVPIKHEDPNDKWIFLKPLSKNLWLTALGLFFGTGISIWILEHRSSEAYQGSFLNQAGMIFYFPFMSLVFAYSEKIETITARGVVVVWMFVVLILSSTYTASLSARLTVQRLSPSVTDANELIRTGVYVGCQSGSFLVEYLEHLGFDKSKIRTYKKPELCAEALSKGSENGGIAALFSTRPYTNLFLSKYGDKYTTVGQTYPTDGYACAFQKGSPLVADVSRTLIELMDSGRIFEIQGQWNMKIPAYNGVLNDTSDLTRISLGSFAVPFAITGGLTTSCVVIFMTIFLYKIYKDRDDFFGSCPTVRSKALKIWNHFYVIKPKSSTDNEHTGDVSSTQVRQSGCHEGTDQMPTGTQESTGGT